MKYFILFVLFLASCKNKQSNNSIKLNEIVTLSTSEKINIDSVLSIVDHGQCVCIGPTGLGGNRTKEFNAYETLDKILTNVQLHFLLKNKSPKIRFAAMNILHDRENTKLFKEGTKLLANDTSLVCEASGCLQIELPINEHIKILTKQRN